MSHGFTLIYTDQDQGHRVDLVLMNTPLGLKHSEFRRLLFDNERKKVRVNPCESVAKVSA